MTVEFASATSGFMYVATGGKYMAEALQSVRSLREHNPGVRVGILTEGTPPVGVFDDVIPINNPVFGFADKLKMIQAPYQRVVFLDTDTLIQGDIRGLFRLLDRHDLAGKLEVYPGWDYEFPDVPMEFIEYNTGLLAFKKSVEMEAFFADWSAEYHALATTSSRYNTDQPSFRRALYRSPLRHCSFPSEYHLQADMGAFLFWDAKVIHCHDHPEGAARLVNRVKGARVYLPGLAVIPTAYTGLRSHLATWAKINWDFLRSSFSRLLCRQVR